MARTKIIIILIALLATTVSIYTAFTLTPGFPCREFSTASLSYSGEHTLAVALARTPSEQQLGLSGCRSLKLGQGMYFIFPVKSDAVFWMKDMIIPIDIIWLSDNKVIGITANIPPPATNTATLPTYSAPAPVNAVLEIGAGHADKLGIRTGTVVELHQ